MSLAGKQRETAAVKPDCQTREIALAVSENPKLEVETMCYN